jgi:hypothetical protein
MKRLFYFLISVLFVSTDVHGQHSENAKAIEEVEKRLKIIKSFAIENVDSSLNTGEAVAFMERLTKLYSESGGGPWGKTDPTKKDYNIWNEWYQQNRLKLYWDERKKKVFVKK